MLVGHYIIFVLGIDGLVVRRHVDFVVWELVFAEVLEEVGVSGTVEVYVRIARVFRLGLVSLCEAN